jgi:hypothetical protein
MDGIESTLTGHCKGLSRKLFLPCGQSALRLQRRRLRYGLQFFKKKVTPWLFNIAMENSPLQMIYDDLPIKNGDFP